MEKIKQKILKFYRGNKRMPTYSELSKMLGFASKNSAYKLAQKLIKEKFFKKDNLGKLIPTKKSFSILKVLGTVEAGFPSPAEEELADTMSLDEYLIENKEASYILRVSGNSMKDAGIIDGDMVIVERGAKPKEGDIVIAEVDGNWTMKYLRKKKNKFYLEAANTQFKNIYASDELKISAVVKSVIRKY